MLSKHYESKKVKTTYILERREYVLGPKGINTHETFLPSLTEYTNECVSKK